VAELRELRVAGSKRRFDSRLRSLLQEPLTTGSTLEVRLSCTRRSSRGGGARGDGGGTVAIRVLEMAAQEGSLAEASEEYTAVGIDLTRRRYFVESGRLGERTVLQTAPMEEAAARGDRWALVVFVDGEVVESFFQEGEVVLTSVNAPTVGGGGAAMRRTSVVVRDAPGVECVAESWALAALRDAPTGPADA
jgi:sucrose-6-phosphate hydrolase SacC (GH32 family)